MRRGEKTRRRARERAADFLEQVVRPYVRRARSGIRPAVLDAAILLLRSEACDLPPVPLPAQDRVDLSRARDELEKAVAEIKRSMVDHLKGPVERLVLRALEEKRNQCVARAALRRAKP